jgi:hypothetical protein
MRTEGGLAFDRRFAPRWTTTLSVHYFGNSDIGDIRAGEVHAAQRFDAGLGWQASRSWTLNASANLERLERQQNSPVTHGWGAVLAATWTPHPRYMSR